MNQIDIIKSHLQDFLQEKNKAGQTMEQVISSQMRDKTLPQPALGAFLVYVLWQEGLIEEEAKGKAIALVNTPGVGFCNCSQFSQKFADILPKRASVEAQWE